MFSIDELCGNAFTVLIIIRLCGISGSCEREGKLKKEFFINFGFINECDNNFNTHSLDPVIAFSVMNQPSKQCLLPHGYLYSCFLHLLPLHALLVLILSGWVLCTMSDYNKSNEELIMAAG